MTTLLKLRGGVADQGHTETVLKFLCKFLLPVVEVWGQLNHSEMIQNPYRDVIGNNLSAKKG